MIRIYKILFASVVCGLIVFTSCKSHTQNTNLHNAGLALNHSDSALRQFMHFFADTLPLPAGYVNDYENLFSTVQETYLNELIDSFERKTTVEIAVVTIDQIMVTAQNFEPLTLQLAKAWGVGKKNESNGILIGICAGHKKLRVQNGSAIEKILSDSATKTIADSSFIPHYKQADYFAGTVSGIKAIIQKLN